MGYQFLDTAFTGTKNCMLSGNDFFPFVPEDKGVAGTLGQEEFKSFSSPCPPSCN
jgi:hypothetical protein